MTAQPEALRLADDLHKAAQQALEALEGFAYHGKAAGWPETITNLRAALAEPVEPAAWRCACGANLFIDADGAPRSKAEPVQEPQTLDAAMQQPRAMAQAYENGYKAGAAAEREAIMDEWSACVQSDLENGVRWLNEQAAKKWQESYPAMAGFADKIYARGETK